MLYSTVETLVTINRRAMCIVGHFSEMTNQFPFAWT